MARVRKLTGIEQAIYNEQEKTIAQGFETTADLIRIIVSHPWFKLGDDIHGRFYHIVPTDYSRLTKEQVKIVKAAWDETHHILSWISAKWPSWTRHNTLDSALYHACPHGSVEAAECDEVCLKIYKDWDNRFKIAEAFVNGDEL